MGEEKRKKEDFHSETVILTVWIDALLPSNLQLKTVPSQASRAGEMGVYPFISPV